MLVPDVAKNRTILHLKVLYSIGPYFIYQVRVASRIEQGALVPNVARNRPILHPKVSYSIGPYFSYQVRVASNIEQGLHVPNVTKISLVCALKCFIVLHPIFLTR